MAKKRRYHQSVKDRMAESRGMEKAMAREDYGGGTAVKCDGSNAYPYMAGSWLEFDKSAPAGMPRNVKMVNAESRDNYGLDVFVPGSKNYIDMVQEEDHKVLKKIVKPSQV